MNPVRAIRRHVKGQRLGAKFREQPDPRAWKFDRLSLGDASKRKVLLQDLPPIYQGRASSCVAHTITQMINGYEVDRGLPLRQRSRLFCYAFARELHNALRIDGGTYHETALDGVRKVGLPLETDWEYSTNPLRVCRRPPISAIRNAFDAREFEYYWITAQGDEMVRQCRSVIDAGLRFGFGHSLQSSYMESDGPVIIDSQSGSLEGGHSQMGDGYDDDLGAFRQRNWWRNWRKPATWITYDYAKRYIRSIFVIKRVEEV